MYKIVSNNSAMTKIVLVVVLVIFLAVVYSRANADNVSMSKIENDLKKYHARYPSSAGPEAA